MVRNIGSDNAGGTWHGANLLAAAMVGKSIGDCHYFSSDFAPRFSLAGFFAMPPTMVVSASMGNGALARQTGQTVNLIGISSRPSRLGGKFNSLNPEGAKSAKKMW
jgi:hypothetical protein